IDAASIRPVSLITARSSLRMNCFSQHPFSQKGLRALLLFRVTTLKIEEPVRGGGRFWFLVCYDDVIMISPLALWLGLIFFNREVHGSIH
ncbi:hypothetical protein, partial [Glutamicibacter arilaitensis]|uniref:hypothetical protein n=1 Tax=Glutamicibacter arilaitensis TaxID=256701 RepID=UPI003FD63803